MKLRPNTMRKGRNYTTVIEKKIQQKTPNTSSPIELMRLPQSFEPRLTEYYRTLTYYVLGQIQSVNL